MAQGLNVLLTGILISLLLVSCKEEPINKSTPRVTEITELDIPDTTVSRSLLHYNNKTSLWNLNNQRYSGYAITYQKDSTIMDKFGVLDGRKQNKAVEYYPDGHMKHLSHYHKGKLHGTKKYWSSDSDHILLSHLNYVSGKLHGEQKKWYPSGELFKKLNLNMGREEGIQQAFRKNGDLYSNYEAKNGRIFGLKKAALCFGIEDEKIKYED